MQRVRNQTSLYHLSIFEMFVSTFRHVPSLSGPGGGKETPGHLDTFHTTQFLNFFGIH